MKCPFVFLTENPKFALHCEFFLDNIPFFPFVCVGVSGVGARLSQIPLMMTVCGYMAAARGGPTRGPHLPNQVT